MNSTAIASPQIPLKTWHPAPWNAFVQYCEDPNPIDVRVLYNNGCLWVDMGNEGINHSSIAQLFSMLFLVWFAKQGQWDFSDLGGCVLEKPKQRGAAPDIMLYVGGDAPRWQPGEPRRINLDRWRVPDLVGEVADTTLATDLDEKKHLYAALGIPEYWVIDAACYRLFAFRLTDCSTGAGKYEACETSGALAGLPLSLVEQTLEQLKTESNGNAARWFDRQLAKL